jgi:predicted DNA-binding transcriptional regulator AlpA
MSEPLYAPRWLRRIEAARWVGMSPSKFDQLVKDRRLPKAKTIDGIVVWDRHQLDGAMELLPDKGLSGDDDDWKVAV